MGFDPEQQARQAWAHDEPLRQCLAEAAQLTRLELPLADFWPAMLAKMCQALGAAGGLAWNRVDGTWQLAGRVGKIPPELAPSPQSTNLPPQSTDADTNFPRHEWNDTGLLSPANAQQRHTKLLHQVRDDGEPCVTPPRVGDGRLDEHGNPTEFLLLLCPIGSTPEFHGLIEIFQRPGAAASRERSLMGVVASACLLANDFLQARHYQSLAGREQLWANWDLFLARVHGSLEPRRVAFEVANEARQLIGCDRVSVALTRRGQQRLTAISGQESFDARASNVQRLERLLDLAVTAGETVWHTGQAEPRSPQMTAALDEYLDVSQVHSLAIIPLARPKADDDQKTQATIGALVCETFGQHEFDTAARLRLEVLTRPSSQALANALAHDELFLMPVWRTLGKSRVLLHARNWPKTRLALVAAAIVLVLLTLVPGRFELEGNGSLQPVVRHEVFAAVDGEVIRVPVEHGQTVEAGQVLCELQNPDLDVQLRGVEGQRNSARKKLHAAQRALLGEGQLSDFERTKLSGDALQVEAELESLDEQLALLEAKQRKLIIRSPIAGQIVTWDALDTLIHRPVKRGDVLLNVVQPDGEWELEARVPESRLGYIAAARDRLGPDRPVRFVLATDPRQKLQGKIAAVHERAEVRGEEGNTVLVRVAFDRGQLASPRPGAEATARIDCGWRPLGFCWLHDVFDWVQAKVLFRLF